MPTDSIPATGDFATGMITFGCLPADKEFTVRFRPGDDREQMDYGYDEIDTFGADLDFGVTLGAFGAMGGGQPEVRMCSASDDTNADATSDEWCATFAYQWETAMLYGKVGFERGHEVEVTPETGHGAIGDEDKTGTGGDYSISDLQDGVYTAEATSGDAKFAILTEAEVEGIELYHNEACWANPHPDNTACDEEDELVVDEVDEVDDTTWAYTNKEFRRDLEDRPAGPGHQRLRCQRRPGRQGPRQPAAWRRIDGGHHDDAQEGRSHRGHRRYRRPRILRVQELGRGHSTPSARAGLPTPVAIHEIKQNVVTNAWSFVTSKTAEAEDYTLTPDEADLDKPYWNRAKSAGGSMGNPTT